MTTIDERISEAFQEGHEAGFALGVEECHKWLSDRCNKLFQGFIDEMFRSCANELRLNTEKKEVTTKL